MEYILDSPSLISVITLISVISGAAINIIRTHASYKAQIEKQVRLTLTVENLQKDVQKVQQTLNNGLSKAVTELQNDQKLIKNEIKNTKDILEMQIKCNYSPHPNHSNKDVTDEYYKND